MLKKVLYVLKIILNMKENDDGSCSVTMSNAGHPYPLFYNAKNDEIEEMLADHSLLHETIQAIKCENSDSLYEQIYGCAY